MSDRDMVFEVTAKLQAERALADDANDIIANLYARALMAGLKECDATRRSEAWLARYREARQR